MGKFVWISVGVAIALPLIAGFAAIPHSADPHSVGNFISGFVTYWKQTLSGVIHL